MGLALSRWSTLAWLASLAPYRATSATFAVRPQDRYFSVSFACSGAKPSALPLPSSRCVGTPEFAAPDLLQPSYDGAAADLWSLGVILYEMLQGFVPFRGSDLGAILRAAARGDCTPLAPGLSAEARDLVAHLLRPAAAERIGMQELLCHPWLAGQLGGLGWPSLGMTLLPGSGNAARRPSAAEERCGWDTEGGEEEGGTESACEEHLSREEGCSSGITTSLRLRGSAVSPGLLSRNSSITARHGSLALVLPCLEGLGLGAGEEMKEVEEPVADGAASRPSGVSSGGLSANSSRRSSASAATSRVVPSSGSSTAQQLTLRAGSFSSGLQRASNISMLK